MAPCIFDALLSSVCRPVPNTFYTSRRSSPVSPWICRANEKFIVWCLLIFFSSHQRWGVTVRSRLTSSALCWTLKTAGEAAVWPGKTVWLGWVTQLGEYGNDVLMLVKFIYEASFVLRNFIHKNWTKSVFKDAILEGPRWQEMMCIYAADRQWQQNSPQGGKFVIRLDVTMLWTGVTQTPTPQSAGIKINLFVMV